MITTRLIRVDPEFKVDFRKTWSPPINLTVPSAIGKRKISPFFGVIISFALSLRAWISDASQFSSSSMSATKISPFQSLPQTVHIQTKLESWLVFRRNRMMFNHWRQTGLLVLSTVFQIALHMVFSHLSRGLEHFADVSNVPSHQPTIFHPSQIATAQQKSLLQFCVLLCLSATPFVSDRRGVDVKWVHDMSSQDLPKFQRIVCVMSDFRFSDGSRKISQTPLRPLRSLGFTRIKLYPLSGYILYHECVSVFSKFTSFTEYFVICCYPVTSALPAKRTRNLGSLALFAISAFSGSE